MYLFFEEGIRGVVSYIWKRYSKASNDYLKSYDQIRDQNILHTYPLAQNKTDKKEMLSNYEIKIVDFYNNPIGIVKKLVPKFFDNAKYVFHYENFI